MASKTSYAFVAGTTAAQQEAADLLQERGNLSAEELWQWAKDHPESAVHGVVTWDRAEAARKWQIEQCREIIASVRIDVENSTPRPFACRVTTESGYYEVAPEADPEEVLRHEIQMALGPLTRLESIPGVDPHVGRCLKALRAQLERLGR